MEKLEKQSIVSCITDDDYNSNIDCLTNNYFS